MHKPSTILFVHKPAERLRKSQNNNRACIHKVVSRKWVNYPFKSTTVQLHRSQLCLPAIGHQRQHGEPHDSRSGIGSRDVN